jgi:hypothetical protein
MCESLTASSVDDGVNLLAFLTSSQQGRSATRALDIGRPGQNLTSGNT